MIEQYNKEEEKGNALEQQIKAQPQNFDHHRNAREENKVDERVNAFRPPRVNSEDHSE